MWSPMTKEDKTQFMILLMLLDSLCIMCDWPSDLNLLLDQTIWASSADKKYNYVTVYHNYFSFEGY